MVLLEDFELFTINVRFSKASVLLNLKLVATWLLHEIGNLESLQWEPIGRSGAREPKWELERGLPIIILYPHDIIINISPFLSPYLSLN